MKKHSLRIVAGSILAVVVVLAGCNDSPTTMGRDSSLDVRVGGPFLSLNPEPGVVDVLKRTVPLLTNLEGTALIGSAGGTVSIPGAGLTVNIPAGALSAPTQIKVTALAGNLVAYTFEPHGTNFAQIVTAEQSLLGTEGIVEGVDSRGYFTTTDAIDWQSGSATVSEISQVKPELAGAGIRFFLNHFSGYLLAVDKNNPPPPLP